MLERGDKVIAGVRNPDNATLLKPLSEQHGSQLTVHKIDVSDATSIQVEQLQRQTIVPSMPY